MTRAIRFLVLAALLLFPACQDKVHVTIRVKTADAGATKTSTTAVR